MDVQLKRGLLDVCVLAAIRDRDSYGYQIIKDMKPYLELSESTLYTILKRLESAGMLTVRSAEFEGRLRKYYHITPRGIGRIEEFREDWEEILSIYRFITRGEPEERGQPGRTETAEVHEIPVLRAEGFTENANEGHAMFQGGCQS